METVKETAANVAASAISGKVKTKATIQEKVDKIRAKDDFQKNLATERLDQRITEAELRKQMAQTHNLDEKEARTTGTGTGTGSYSANGMTGAGAGTGAHGQMSATERLDERITDAELSKQKAQTHNLDEKEARTGTGTGTGSYSANGMTGAGTGAHGQMSAMPGHETGQPTGGHVVEGTAVGSHPIGKGTGTGTRSTTAENRHVGGGTTNTGLTGSGYSG